MVDLSRGWSDTATLRLYFSLSASKDHVSTDAVDQIWWQRQRNVCCLPGLRNAICLRLGKYASWETCRYFEPLTRFHPLSIVQQAFGTALISTSQSNTLEVKAPGGVAERYGCCTSRDFWRGSVGMTSAWSLGWVPPR